MSKIACSVPVNSLTRISDLIHTHTAKTKAKTLTTPLTAPSHPVKLTLPPYPRWLLVREDRNSGERVAEVFVSRGEEVNLIGEASCPSCGCHVDLAVRDDREPRVQILQVIIRVPLRQGRLR